MCADFLVSRRALSTQLALSTVNDMIYIANVRPVFINQNLFVNSQHRSLSEASVRVPGLSSESVVSSTDRLSFANGHGFI